jgi:hypothetical protein
MPFIVVCVCSYRILCLDPPHSNWQWQSAWASRQKMATVILIKQANLQIRVMLFYENLLVNLCGYCFTDQIQDMVSFSRHGVLVTSSLMTCMRSSHVWRYVTGVLVMCVVRFSHTWWRCSKCQNTSPSTKRCHLSSIFYFLSKHALSVTFHNF